MARITGYGTAINTSTLDFTRYAGGPTENVDGRITLTNGALATTITGTFTTSATWQPSGGFITEVTQTMNGQASLTATDLGLPTATYAVYSTMWDVEGLLSWALSGADDITGSSANDTLAAGSGLDVVRAGDGNDSLAGASGSDILLGNRGDDTLLGGSNNDSLYGGLGNDQIFGGEDDDLAFGHDGTDRVCGNLGNDVLLGNAGTDTVYGGSGDDALFGGRDDDLLFGDSGADTLYGDPGTDTLTGGAGADRFVIGLGGGTDTITDFSYLEGDRLVVQGAGSSVATDGGLHVDLSDGSRVWLQGLTGAPDSDWIMTV